MATFLAPAIVDLQANAVNLATRLGSLVHFLEAAHELRTCRNSPSHYFRRHSRKIVALVEIARRTLQSAGLQIHLFSSCPDSLAPSKAAYVDLLDMLKERRSDVDPALTERVRRLLFPLCSNFHITRKGEHPPPPLPRVTGDVKMRASSQQPRPSTSQSPLATSPDAVPINPMPPPDPFPVALATPTRVAKRRVTDPPRRYWNVPETPPMRRRRSSDFDNDQENAVPPPRLTVRPLQKRFGIFCTSKTSMHQYRQPTSHPRVMRPLKE
ncbi:hypothetical protein LshimejAT787_1601410 [Lyophyllum shimeji]|uniref:Uncharacterized protein n=1 Tax=Lyophyllum shimeji TaxID=47721 RepID=A0A9P3PYZ5_LYOSH|nr:hypothetical protein LshimejAT787_1601410 [Lyophyllum shimeji]